jgi:hypothetical protein
VSPCKTAKVRFPVLKADSDKVVVVFGPRFSRAYGVIAVYRANINRVSSEKRLARIVGIVDGLFGDDRR